MDAVGSGLLARDEARWAGLLEMVDGLQHHSNRHPVAKRPNVTRHNATPNETRLIESHRHKMPGRNRAGRGRAVISSSCHNGVCAKVKTTTATSRARRRPYLQAISGFRAGKKIDFHSNLHIALLRDFV